MTDSFCLSFRFLSPAFHGRSDGGAAEWPPSPLRAFQALVASAARLGELSNVTAAFQWLEALPAPSVIAPRPLANGSYRLSVPNNSMDVVAANWSRGGDAGAAGQRTMKDVRPVLLPAESVVHFVWSAAEYPRPHVEALVRAARSVVALGWGLDLVVGFGALISQGERAALLGAAEGVDEWRPVEAGTRVLRAPVAGTLTDLERRHQAFLSRTSLEPDAPFKPPAAISVFDSVEYASAAVPASAPLVAFQLMRSGDSDRFASFESARRGAVVAGQLRDLVRRMAERAGWDEERVRSVVLGHGEARDAQHVPVSGHRLLLLPLPSLEPRESGERVDAIRRVAISSTDPSDVAWLRRALSGQSLIDEATKKSTAFLSEVSGADKTVMRYRGASTEWVSVTPVVLPGRDDPGGVLKRLASKPAAEEQKQLLQRLERRREGLVRKALRHAGVPDAVVFAARVEVRQAGFVAGVENAARYRVPQHLEDAPRFHVRVQFESPVSGPLSIGRGRFSGMGLLVGERSLG